MFANNNKISLRQLKRMLVFDLFSVSSIIMPRIAFVSTGRDGGIAIVLGTLYAFIYAFFIISLAREMKGEYLSYAKDSVGSILTFVIGSLYIVKLFFCAVFVCKLFGEVIKLTLLEGTDNRIIVLFLLIVSAYLASKGLEARARVAEMLFLVVLVPIGVFLILALRDVDVTNLLPLLSENTKTIAYGGYEIFLTFSILEMLLFLVPFVKYRVKDKKKKRTLSKYVAYALAITGVFNLLFFIVTLGILGQGQTKHSLMSMVYMIQVVKLPGGFLQRQDAIVLGLWLSTIFTLTSGFLYYMVVIGKQLFRVEKQNYLLIPLIVIMFGVASYPMEAAEMYDYFSFYMKFIGMPQSVILPLFVVLIGKLKKSVNKTSVAKNLCLLFLISSVVTLTGCADKTEIEDRNFIQAVGVDYTAGIFRVYYILPDLKVLTGEGTMEPEELIISLEGTNFQRVEDEYHMRYNKRLDLSHLKSVIIGHDLALNKEAFTEFIKFVQDRYELGKNVLIFVASSDAKEIVDLNGNLEGGIGDYLDRMYRINLSNTDKEEVTIGDLVRGMNNENEVVRLPILRAVDERIMADGLGLFQRNLLIHETSEETTTYLDLANGYGKNQTFFIETQHFKEEEFVLTMNKISKKFEYSLSNNKPVVDIYIEGKATIDRGIVISNELPNKMMYYSHTMSKAKEKEVNEIQEHCQAYMKARIEEIFENLLKEEKVDFLNLYRRSSYLNSKIWYQYEERLEDFLKDVSYTINFKLALE